MLFRSPYPPYTADLRKEIATGSIRLATTLSAAVQQVLSKALATHARERHASATEFATELRRVLDSRPLRTYRWRLAGVLLVACAIVAALTVHRVFNGRLDPGQQPAGRLLVSGIGDQTFLEGKLPSAWIKQGVFAEIKGPGAARFPRLPASTFVLEVDLEMRNPAGRISFYTGEPGAGVDLPFGGLWPQDSGNSKIPCRLFRSQPWGVNWSGETHFPANERMTLKLVVNDDFKAVVRNGAVVLGSSGDASDLCLTLTSTEDTDATIYRATCRRLTREDAEEANQHFTAHALDCDVDETRQRLASQLGSSWNRHPEEIGRVHV